MRPLPLLVLLEPCQTCCGLVGKGSTPGGFSVLIDARNLDFARRGTTLMAAA